MRKRGSRPGMVAAIVLGTSAPAYAGGFYVPEIGTRAAGLGAAVTADADDPSATFHNPALLVEAEGNQVEGGAGLFFPDITFFRRPVEDPNTGDTIRFDRVENTNAVIPAPYLGASRALGTRAAVGLAVYAPFGATLDFPIDGAQRQVVTTIALRTVTVSPAAAVRVGSGFSVGLSANLIYGDLTLDQRNAIPYVTGDPEQYPDPQEGLEGTTAISGKDPFSLGATLGVAWKSADGRIRAGASVMSPVTLHLEGDARVENASIAPLMDADGNEMQPAGVREDQVKIAMPLPLIARVGVAVRPAPGWRVGADVNFQRWSTFETLTVDFVHEYELLPTPGANLYDVHVENAWKDTWSARLGVEANPWKAPIVARAGLVYDQSPVDDRHFALLTPDSDKVGVSAGARWSTRLGKGRLDLDLAAVHLFLAERDVAPSSDGMPGSDGTILNKPAPSFFHGVTRAGFDVITLAVGWRL